MYPDHADLEYL